MPQARPWRRFMETLASFRACFGMSFSNSAFTVEISGVAAAVFHSKWHSEADEVCRAWVRQHFDQLRINGRHGSELPAVVRLRLAHANEKAAYDLASGEVENYDGIKVINLVDPGNRPWAHPEGSEMNDCRIHARAKARKPAVNDTPRRGRVD